MCICVSACYVLYIHTWLVRDWPGPHPLNLSHKLIFSCRFMASLSLPSPYEQCLTVPDIFVASSPLRPAEPSDVAPTLQCL